MPAAVRSLLFSQLTPGSLKLHLIPCSSFPITLKFHLPIQQIRGIRSAFGGGRKTDKSKSESDGPDSKSSSSGFERFLNHIRKMSEEIEKNPNMTKEEFRDKLAKESKTFLEQNFSEKDIRNFSKQFEKSRGSKTIIIESNRLHNILTTVVVFSAVIFYVFSSFSRNAVSQMPGKPRYELFLKTARTITLDEFLSDYLKTGEVEQIVIMPVTSQALVFLHEGAIINQNPVDTNVLAISIGSKFSTKSLIPFEQTIRNAEKNLGIDPSDKIPMSVDYSLVERTIAANDFRISLFSLLFLILLKVPSVKRICALLSARMDAFSAQKMTKGFGPGSGK